MVEEKDIDSYKNSWNAFLDSYSALQTRYTGLDDLVTEILESANNKNPKFVKYKEAYLKITGKDINGKS